MNPRPVLAWILTATALAGAPAIAEDALPPERPTTPYRALIRNSYSITEPGGGKSGGDTLEIRVSGPRLVEKSQLLDQKTAIVDTLKHEVIEFDEKGKDKVAARFPLNDAPIPYIDGRTALAAYDSGWPAPTVAGKDKVAKQKCTIIYYGKPGENGITACVSKEGVVLRAKIDIPDYQREFEALEFDAGEQDEKHFAPPKDFEVVGAGEGAEEAQPE